MDQYISGIIQSSPGRSLEDAAWLFEKISMTEKQHEKRYRDLLANVEACKVFDIKLGTLDLI